MALSLAVVRKNYQVDNFVDLFDGGNLTIYNGAVPADADTALSGQTVLAQVDPLPTPAFGAAASGTASKSGTWQDASADATGTATFFRAFDSGASILCQGTITATGGGGDMELSTTSLVAAQVFTVTAFSVTQP